MTQAHLSELGHALILLHPISWVKIWMMIPVRLRMKGFLSYREAAEIDFSGFELACISGPNGAGKSSLLDAMTWALFGQARKRDEAVINASSAAAEVIFIFFYEGNIYRIQRALARGKSTVLEFQVGVNGDAALTEWRPLTERAVRETQARIQQVLRLDYDTFVNASFFVQGKADQFTQQRPTDRKRILASILGLDAWEVYRERTAERRKGLEGELSRLDGRLAEIEAELLEEPIRKKQLAVLEAQLETLAATTRSQGEAVESIRRLAGGLAEQRRLVESLAIRSERAASAANELAGRMSARTDERRAFKEMLADSSRLEAAYQDWLKARAELERWDRLAEDFREHERRRQPYLDEINAQKAMLEQERSGLLVRKVEAGEQASELQRLDQHISATGDRLQETEAKLRRRDEIVARLDGSRQEFAALRAENESLRKQMDEIQERIGRIQKIESPDCPLCGQPLSPAHRATTMAELQTQGTGFGDLWRDNKSRMDNMATEALPLENELSDLRGIDDARAAQTGLLSELRARREAASSITTEWKQSGAKRLAQIEKLLAKQAYSSEARQALKALEQELKDLGYDVTAHEQARKMELAGRESEGALRRLESARAALAPIERELRDLKEQLAAQQSEAASLMGEYEAASERMAAAEAQAPDLQAAEVALLNAQERENVMRQELGAAKQKVLVLDDLRERKAEFLGSREIIAASIAQHKILERAFGKDGVPALLIEQALPDIESHANDLLDRLSNGAMSVRFVTQAEYKDKKREDLKETLDIVISDSSGTRDYEMFSGGEAFRVNFAIRLALSRVLAQRTGARLQMLVIDEGFGSQDAQGRQRLIEAINLSRADFAKILIITHMDELKEAFPNRIEVEKTATGSVVSVF